MRCQFCQAPQGCRALPCHSRAGGECQGTHDGCPRVVAVARREPAMCTEIVRPGLRDSCHAQARQGRRLQRPGNRIVDRGLKACAPQRRLMCVERAALIYRCAFLALAPWLGRVEPPRRAAAQDSAACPSDLPLLGKTERHLTEADYRQDSTFCLKARDPVRLQCISRCAKDTRAEGARELLDAPTRGLGSCVEPARPGLPSLRGMPPRAGMSAAASSGQKCLADAGAKSGFTPVLLHAGGALRPDRL